ncbi:MAG TPA: hypothetical protein K8W03_01435 [Bifidobacterium pseudolongum subsp. globosum]|nr:hypothetical protein [Bifidobacterium pseudolongum subsp. globosum]
MISSKHGYVGTRKCVKYSGTHEELRDMLKEGDIVTLLWQNYDKSESIKITGTVTHCGLDSIDVLTSYDEEEYVLDNPNVLARRKYTITNIRRPVENMLPDAPGPWTDKDDDTWIVNENLSAIRVSCDGEWWIGGGIFLPSEYADYAPFKKINIIKESWE